MSHNWVENPLDEIQVATDEQEQTVTPHLLSSYVTGTTISKLPPFDVAPRDIVSKSGPISISIQLDRTSFITNGNVEGSLHVTCRKEGVWKIGKIQVYLVGLEEVLPVQKNLSHQRVFLSKWVDFQDDSLVPSDAVYAGKCDEHGMYKAKEGTTKFDFSIPLAKVVGYSNVKTSCDVDGPLPSSFWNKRHGGIRYIVAGVVTVKNGIHKLTAPLAAYKEPFVVESLPYGIMGTFKTMMAPTCPQMAEVNEKLKRNIFGFGKKGFLKVNATVRLAETENNHNAGVWISGGIGWLGIEIKNSSPKPVIELKVQLVRRLKTFMSQDVVTSGSSPTLTHVEFSRQVMSERILSTASDVLYSGVAINDPRQAGGGFSEEDLAHGQDVLGTNNAPFWDGVQPHETRAFVLDVNIPNHARSIRYGLFVDVSYAVEISVKAKGCNATCLKIPVTIVHPLSLVKALPVIKLNAEVISPRMVQEPQTAPMEKPMENLSQTTLDDIPTIAESDLKVSRATLLKNSKSSPKDERSNTLNKSNTFGKNPFKNSYGNSGSAMSSYMTIRKPIVRGPSPAAMTNEIPQLFIPPPPSLPPSISALKAANMQNNVQDTTFTELSEQMEASDSLEGVPRMDLVNEIDKLFTCVPMD